MNVTLPDTVRPWLIEQATREGYASPDEYVHHLLQREQERASRTQIEVKLLDGLDSGPASPMTASDWTSLRQRIDNGIEVVRVLHGARDLDPILEAQG